LRAQATTADPVRVRRRRAPAYRLAWRWTALALALVLVVLGLIGLVYAGSSDRLADGVKIGGVDVGGLSSDEAENLLARKAAALVHVPVVFKAEGKQWEITPHRLGVRVDWGAAVNAAQNRGDGFGPVRGLRRLKVRFFGAEIAPPAHVYAPALSYQVSLLAKQIDQPHRDAALRRRGFHISVVHGQDGRILDRKLAVSVLVHSLASLTREPVALPVKVDKPTVTPKDLAPAARQARRALRSSVQLRLPPTAFRIRRGVIATLLDLPRNGRSELRLGGPGARRYFAKLRKQVNRPPRNADWEPKPGGIRLVPAADGRVIDLPTTEKAIFAALVSPTDKSVRITVSTVAPRRSTAEATAMGITGLVGGYETFYSGDPNRIHNVQLVSHLIDHTLIAPGATFSFNATTGERNASKGFLEAPVIINGELQTGLGGGVCQVSTTTFNAAYEAGLDITDRTNHALYISHYPTGRDATVNYPDTDLKFVNDTSHWLLLRTFVGSSSLVVNLYGTPQHRRVETETAPLKNAGPVPVRRIPDGNVLRGQTVIQEAGSPPLETSVHRRVYTAGGELLHDDVWYSSYRGETRVVRYGTKKPPPPPPPPEEKKKEEKKTTTTTTTETTPTETGRGNAP